MQIEDYGLIGDLQTASSDATARSTGSASRASTRARCFAALLGDESSGRWLLSPDCEIERVEPLPQPRSCTSSTSTPSTAAFA
jgi:hypothetical protein